MPPRYRCLRHFIHWHQTERPVDWNNRFGRGDPTALEIGFGNGEYLVREALARPDWNFIGLDIRWASVLRALRKISEHGVGNVRVLQADARTALERLIRPGTLRQAYALFPCPWPKEHHAKHRVFSNDFLKLLNSRMADSAQARIVTDDENYLRWILRQTPGSGFKTLSRRIPPSFDTVYEKRWRKQGQQSFFELVLEKTDPCDASLKEDAPVQTHRVNTFDPERYAPQNDHGEPTVEFKEFLYDPQRKKAMSRVMIAEEGLLQDIWIEIAKYDDGWKIRPAWGCRMVPTAGVQRALDLMFEAAGKSIAQPAKAQG